MTHQQPAFGQVDLTDCDREPIRIPGSIQPHGVLLALDPVTLTVLQVAGDTVGLIGQTHAELLGQPLRAELDAATPFRLQSLVRRDQVLPRPPFIVEATVQDRALDICAHLSGGLVVLELEPRTVNGGPDSVEMVRSMMAEVDTTETLSAMLDTVAREVQAISSYDRVMVYRFREDASGHVVAEARSRPEVDSFLDLHYPASDIPVQARALYRCNWIRAIPDVAYQPQPLVPADNPVTGEPLDLSFSTLRSVSPMHLEYLTNMGVGSSMSLSLVVGGELWGLIACHHAKPLLLGSRTRVALELFAQLVSLQLRSRLELAQSQLRIVARDTMSLLVTAMSGDGLECLLDKPPNLLDLVAARSVAVSVNGVVSTLGDTPAPEQLRALVEWLNATMPDGVFATHTLSALYPPAAEFLASGAGMLALSISRSPRDYVLWFLPELVTTVTWAGTFDKSVTPGPHGARLTPRLSFAAWTQTVEAAARPWEPVEIESATSLRVAILDVVLRQVDQLARERERAKIQQDLLIAELDHRVKNILATIKAVVRFSGRSAADMVSYTRALERRIASMAQSHDLLTQSRWEGASLRALVTDEMAAHRPRDDASIQLSGPDITLDAQAAMAVSLVIHELATNAVKHGCLSVGDGMLLVNWSVVGPQTEGADAGYLRLHWQETCGPYVSPPTRTGFGRILLERVFANDVQGRASLDFRPDGLRCVLEIPPSHLVGRGIGSVDTPVPTAVLPVTAGSLQFAGRRILVVEDAALVALEVTEVLEAEGAEVVGPYAELAPSLATAQTASIDLALLDVDLSGQPTWPVAEALAARGIPIVFATGFSDASRRPPAFRDTATIRKPYDTNALLRIVADALRGR